MITEFIANKALAMIFSFLILGQAYALRRLHGTWVFPGAIFGLFWFLMSMGPLLLVPMAPINPAGVFILLTMCIAFSAGAIFIRWDQMDWLVTGPTLIGTKKRVLWIALGASIIAALVCLAVNSQEQGISLDRALSAQASAEYTVARYSGNLVVNLFAQLAVLLSYVTPGIGGFLYRGLGNGRKFLCIAVSLLPAIFVMLTQGAKGAFVLAIAIFYGAVLARSINEGEYRLFSPGLMNRVAPYFGIGGALILWSFAARLGLGVSQIRDAVEDLYRYFASYSSGHLYAFSDWASSKLGGSSRIIYSAEEYTAGFYTFTSLFRLAGDKREVPPGTFAEYFAVGDVLQTNIYTMYRGLVTDFGFVGAWTFMIIMGSLSHLLYYRMLKNRDNPVFPALFVVFIAATYSSAYISIFQYNNIYILPVILTIVFMVQRNLAPSSSKQVSPSTAGQSK